MTYEIEQRSISRKNKQHQTPMQLLFQETNIVYGFWFAITSTVGLQFSRLGNIQWALGASCSSIA